MADEKGDHMTNGNMNGDLTDKAIEEYDVSGKCSFIMIPILLYNV
jgi:hypothetical protein